ncbi:MAG: hypothetical protein AB7N65_09355 [Vicinamibacterales bacterium]
MTRLAEERQSFLILTASPLVWAAHLLLSYATAAVWCAKQQSPLSPLVGVRLAIGVYTAVSLAAIAGVAWIGYRAHRFGAAPSPHDADTPDDRHRFIGLATLLLSGLGAVAVTYQGLVALFVETCE